MAKSRKAPEELLACKGKKLLTHYELSTGKVLIGVYQGNKSEFDIIVKHKTLKDGKWTRPRQPNHLQWAVDLIVKKSHKKRLTYRFIEKLIKLWDGIHGATSSEERNAFLDSSNINKELNSLSDLLTLNKYGEYDIETLFVLMKLLAFQEKTNRADARVFKTILDYLHNDKMNYQIINATKFKAKK